MFARMLFTVGLVALTACSGAKMAMDPALSQDFDAYKITEKPSPFSGGQLVFGPYKATDFDRDWTKGRKTSVGRLKQEKKSQSFRFIFTSERKWEVECVSGSGSFSVKFQALSVKKSDAAFYCSFVSGDKTIELQLAGSKLINANGFSSLGDQKIKITANNRLEGSRFAASVLTGFFIYQDNKLIAAIDKISGKGPVWIHKSLSNSEKGQIAMFAASLLLLEG